MDPKKTRSTSSVQATPGIRQLDTRPKSNSSVPTWLAVVILIVAGLVGGFGGWLMAGRSSSSPDVAPQAVKTESSAGVKDAKQFPDDAEGLLKEGGIEGEGSYHLERPGGESQNVYLTSSIVDLSEFVGKKVKVLGQTFDSEKAGWLMDVGYVEVL